jgi:hypothetical protein
VIQNNSWQKRTKKVRPEHNKNSPQEKKYKNTTTKEPRNKKNETKSNVNPTKIRSQWH